MRRFGCSVYLILNAVDQRPAPDARAMLLAELEDFVARHRPCGKLMGDATEPEADGYSMIWSARARSGGGIVRPRAWAVTLLMTSS